MIGVVDHRVGNLRSLLNAFEALEEPVKVITTPQEMKAASAVVVPGVGAFKNCMDNLREAGLIEALNEVVMGDRKPFFGVCLGMQILADKSFEHGEHKGLGWLPGSVERIAPRDPQFRVPHMGWNTLENIKRESRLFRGIEGDPVVYFVHSYHIHPAAGAEEYVTSTCDHGMTITASVEKDNIFGAQFHPEKSQHTGLSILKNFIGIAHGEW